jgi:hypothetical protein
MMLAATKIMNLLDKSDRIQENIYFSTIMYYKYAFEIHVDQWISLKKIAKLELMEADKVDKLWRVHSECK